MTEINLLLGAITEFRADAIVTAANSSLIGGEGVDGAIHSAAGPKLLKSLIKFKGCNPGNVVVTEAFELDAKFIIHAVGLFMQEGKIMNLNYCFQPTIGV